MWRPSIILWSLCFTIYAQEPESSSSDLLLQVYLYEQTAKSLLESGSPSQAIVQCEKAQNILSLLPKNSSAGLRIQKLLTASLASQKTTQPVTIYALPSKETLSLSEKVSQLTLEKNILLTRPLRSEVEDLSFRLKEVTFEREALALHLETTEELYEHGKAQITNLKNSLKSSSETQAIQMKFMDEERATSHVVITSQRRRSKAQSHKLRKTQQALAEMELETKVINSLIEESSQQYIALSKHFHALQMEQEQLRGILYGDQDLNHLKRKHFELKKELQKVYATLNTSSSKETQQEYLTLKANLSETKEELKESQAVSQRLTSLLKQARYALQINDSPPLTSSETTLLKGAVNNQMQQQENRRDVRELMLAKVQQLQRVDKETFSALRLTEAQELSFNQNEALLKPSVRHLTTRKKDLAIYESLGRAAYLNGRLLAAREFFEINITLAPDHVPSLLNLGVILLRQASDETYLYAIQTFKKAVTASGKSPLPYAYQMMGYCYYKQGLPKKAQESLNKCLSLTSENAVAHTFLGIISGEQKLFVNSEKSFRRAIFLDPTLPEPQYNLALLLAHQGKRKEAKVAYLSALKKGAVSDSGIEAKL